jgi:hypothetical protein
MLRGGWRALRPASKIAAADDVLELHGGLSAMCSGLDIAALL